MQPQHQEEKPVSRTEPEASKEGSYSGAKFEADNGTGLLVKSATNINQSAMMQAEFYNRQDKLGFSTPRVLCMTRDSITMEMVPRAINAAQFFCTYPTEIEREVEAYVNFISGNIKGTELFPQAPFIRKILQIINRLNKVEDIRLCERVAVELPTEFNLPIGDYHGDFTFSNILYPGRYLIDFTPSYINSPIMDVVKLKQEYKLAWTYMVCFVSSKFNYSYSLEVLRQCVEGRFRMETGFLEAMNLLRILPYAKTDDMSKLLRQTIKELIW